jgi:hypothetical protein
VRLSIAHAQIISELLSDLDRAGVVPSPLDNQAAEALQREILAALGVRAQDR